MKTVNTSNGHLAELVTNSQATIHNLTEHMRSTAEKPRRILDTRRRNDVLRELGQLHYDSHHTGAAPHQPSIDRLIAKLDSLPRDLPEDDETSDDETSDDDE